MKRKVLISLLATVIMMLIMAWQGSSLKTELTPHGILDLEFAGSEKRLIEILSVWQLNKVYQNIYLDFLFIVAYSAFFFFSCRLISQSRKNKLGMFLGRIFLVLSILPGLIDIAENICMLVAVSNDPQVIPVGSYLAFIKFLLASIILLYIIISLPVVFSKKN